MIKRIISAIIICILILSVCSCTPTHSIVGTWEYDNNYGLKDLVSDQIDDAYFYKIYYQFNEDGTGKTWTSYSPDLKAEFTYEFDGYKLTVDLENGGKQTLDVDLQLNQFTVSDGKEDMVFIRIED